MNSQLWWYVARSVGIVAWALLAVELTSLLRKRISKRAWRLTHYLSFPLFLLTTVHALSAGTDRSTFPLRVTVASVAALVTALTFVRLNRSEHHDLLTSPPTPA